MQDKILKWLVVATLVGVFFVCFLNRACCAANHCVSSDGTGDGSDWSQPMAFPASTSFVRGDTYYIADGTYTGEKTLGKAVSGTDVITILKATVSAHGTNTGWDNAFGDGVATFTANATATIDFTTGYWVFDGITGSGTTGHGFKITTTDSVDNVKVVRIDNGADNITLSHCEIQHIGMDSGLQTNDTFYCTSSTDNGSKDITVSYNYMHDVNEVCMLIRHAERWTIEHNYFANRWTSGANPHGEAISIGTSWDCIFRYNTFKDIFGTGVIVFLDSVQSYFWIYSNLFYSTDARYTWSNGAITNSTGDTNDSTYVYQNTFCNGVGYNQGVWFSNGSNNEVKNNVWYNCAAIKMVNNLHQYNYYINCTFTSGWSLDTGEVHTTGNPFSSPFTYNFTLAENSPLINGGTAIGSPYQDADLAGIAYTTNDIGCYSYHGTSEPPNTAGTGTRTVLPFMTGE